MMGHAIYCIMVPSSTYTGSWFIVSSLVAQLVLLHLSLFLSHSPIVLCLYSLILVHLYMRVIHNLFILQILFGIIPSYHHLLLHGNLHILGALCGRLFHITWDYTNSAPGTDNPCGPYLPVPHVFEPKSYVSNYNWAFISSLAVSSFDI